MKGGEVRVATDSYGIPADGLNQIILFHDRTMMEDVVAANPQMIILVGEAGSYSEKEFPGVYIAAVKANRRTGTPEDDLIATQI